MRDRLADAQAARGRVDHDVAHRLLDLDQEGLVQSERVHPVGVVQGGVIAVRGIGPAVDRRLGVERGLRSGDGGGVGGAGVVAGDVRRQLVGPARHAARAAGEAPGDETVLDVAVVRLVEDALVLRAVQEAGDHDLQVGARERAGALGVQDQAAAEDLVRL